MPEALRDFLVRQAARDWAGPALVAFAVLVLLFALAGETANSPFVYSQAS